MLQAVKHVRAGLAKDPSFRGRWAFALCLWLGTDSLVSTAAAASLKLEGRLDAQLVRWDGSENPSPKAHAVTKFRVQIAADGRRWLLENDYGPDWFWLVGCDGTNTYSELVTPGCTAHPPCSGFVFSGAFPLFNDYNITLPWLAFCSPDYIHDPQTAQTIPILGRSTMIDPFAHTCISLIERSTAAPYLPARVTWITSSNRLAHANTDPMLRIEGQAPDEIASKRLDYSKSMPPGIVLADYRVTSWTNVHDLQIPLAFKWEGFAYANPQQKDLFEAVLQARHKTNSLVQVTFTNDTWLDGYYAGIVTSLVEWTEEPVELPGVEHPMQVLDYRLSDRSKGIDYVIYATTDWKRTVDNRLLRLLKAKQKHPPGIPRDTSELRVLLLVALATVFLAPVIVTLIAQRRKHGNMNPSKKQVS